MFNILYLVLNTNFSLQSRITIARISVTHLALNARFSQNTDFFRARICPTCAIAVMKRVGIVIGLETGEIH